ncbi:unnamed protein product [Amoebophrya sp. A25]|nr:unnamed protein product [Amoebophrya sp. A25]|eukprot:GSA25T00003706001.1
MPSNSASRSRSPRRDWRDLCQQAARLFKSGKRAVDNEDSQEGHVLNDARNRQADLQEAARMWRLALERCGTKDGRPKSADGQGSTTNVASLWADAKVITRNLAKCETQLSCVALNALASGSAVERARYHVKNVAGLATRKYMAEGEATDIFRYFAETVRDEVSAGETRFRMLRAFLEECKKVVVDMDTFLGAVASRSTAGSTQSYDLAQHLRTECVRELVARQLQCCHRVLEMVDLGQVRVCFDDDDLAALVRSESLVQEACRLLLAEDDFPPPELLSDAKFLSHRTAAALGLARATRRLRDAMKASSDTSDLTEVYHDALDDLVLSGH